MRKTQPEAPGLHLSRWLFILFMFGHALAGCDGGSPTDGNAAINTSSTRTNNANRGQAINTNSTNSAFINVGPVFVSLPSVIQVPENQRFVYQVEVTHPMNKGISFSLSGNNANQFDLSTSGTLSFKEEPNFEHLSNPQLSASITISDGSIMETRNIIIVVTNVSESLFGEANFNDSLLQ